MAQNVEGIKADRYVKPQAPRQIHSFPLDEAMYDLEDAAPMAAHLRLPDIYNVRHNHTI